MSTSMLSSAPETWLWPSASSVTLGEGRPLAISSRPASDARVEFLAFLVAQVNSSLEYLRRQSFREAPEYFDFTQEPGIPVRLTISSVSTPPFCFDDED